MKFGKLSGLTLGVLLTLSFLAFSIIPLKADTSTELQVVNPVDGSHLFNFTSDTMSVGDTFIINITVVDITDLQNWQIKLTWDSSLLDFVDIWLPSDHVFTGKPVISPPTDTGPGYVIWGATYINIPYWTFNGTGRLCQMELEIIQGVSEGIPWIVECALAFDRIGFDTFLLDGASHDISFTPMNGHYVYQGPPPSAAEIYMDPLRVVDPAFTPGSVFNVSLSIINATNVHYWSSKIFYGNDMLNATQVTEGEFLKSAGSTSFNSAIQHDYNSTHGMIQTNCTLLDGGVNENGTLAIIILEVLALGESVIAVSEPELLDPSSNPLLFTTSDGYFNNVLMAKLRVQPSEVSGPEYTPGSTFTINVTLEDVENLKVCVFNLTYIPSVILETSVFVPPVLGQIPIKRLQIDDVAGYIWAEVTYPDQITTYDPVTIMMVEFQVVALGVSPINLTDTELYDIDEQSITHEAYHGIFVGLIRDVAVVAVTLELDVAYQGCIVSVNVTVRNEGNLTETFDVEIYYDVNLGGTDTVVDLPPGEETTMVIAWNTTDAPPCHNYTISATASSVPYEFDLLDNTLTDGEVRIRIMGDVDGDGIVNMRDIQIICDAYGSSPERPEWNPYADLNRDRRIDLRDIGLSAINYQKSCPP